MVIISILYNFRKETLPISTLKTGVSTPVTKQVDIAIIGTDTYCTTCKLKEAQIFVVSKRVLEY